ncbi:hypothetical protein [Sodalis-like endosymbiont of Proechinophthirus fluctus]|uniref:hypothetical protein n=1 Tax=Sodalis-like endosymbiont of Proechinophthirus fluctus TaxID=1462730 RepID=UPI000B2F2605
MEKTLLAYEAPDLDLLHLAELDAERGITMAAEWMAIDGDKRTTHTEGESFNSYFGTYVFW